jgi:MFS transporter, CP family, cyanate transporter
MTAGCSTLAIWAAPSNTSSRALGARRRGQSNPDPFEDKHQQAKLRYAVTSETTAQNRGELRRSAALVTAPDADGNPRVRSTSAVAVGAIGFAIAVVVISINLRAAVASVGPELNAIRRDLGLSSAGASVLTAAPVFCFGALAVLGPWLTRRFGLRRAVLLSMLAILVGLIVRIGPDIATLFIGTLIAAGGIASANVLMPVIIKRDFPDTTGLMMGLYTAALVGSAAAGAGLTVPIGQAFGSGWRVGLGVWAVLAAVGVVIWLPHLRGDRVADVEAGHVPAQLRHDRLAWLVTLFFGLQSLNFYAVLNWLPSLYQDHGYSAAAAGGLLSLSALVQLPVALVLPAIASRMHNQRSLVVGAVLLTAIGFVGILVAPTTLAALWVVILGVGQGAAFAIALILLVLRTRTHESTTQLSAMAQSVGYLIAGVGPLVVGVMHATSGGWTTPIVFLLILLVPETITGLRAASPGFVTSS